MDAHPNHSLNILLTENNENQGQQLERQLETEQDHIWWGVSVEDQKYGLPRISDLQKAPARVRFLSIEPLLEDLGAFNLSGISWAIVGGESGPGARPMREEWVISVRDQCHESRVPFFFKQWGGVRKAKHGRLLEGRTYDEYPRRVASPIPDRASCVAILNSFRKGFQGDRLIQPTA